MHNIKYEDFMRSLGLSTHPAQCARRMQKYPTHFKAKNNQVYISVDYARFLLAQHKLVCMQQQLLGNSINKEVRNGN